MITAEEIIRIAANEIGYREGENNRNKYGEEYGWNEVAWCVQFVWWIFHQAGADKLFGPKTASCTQLMNNHIEDEIPLTDIQPGDIVFFDWTGGTETEHVGIVENRQGTTVITIEGNTGDVSQSDGDGVFRKSRNIRYVSRAFRPAYVSGQVKEREESTAQTVTITLPELAVGAEGYEVKTIQRLLMSYGYSMSPYGADGEFGMLTEKRVKEFQKKRGLDADGIVGLQTWTALLKG